MPALSRSLREDKLSSTHAVKLWRNNFEAGFALAPPIAVATASSLAFCGWSARSLGASGLGGRDARLFFVAAALTVGIVPYTLALMKGTNDRLLGFAKRDELTASESRESEELLKKWTVLNGVRSLLPLGAAVLTGALVLV